MPAAEAEGLVAVFDQKTSRSSTVAVHFHPDVVDSSENDAGGNDADRENGRGHGIRETKKRLEAAGQRLSASVSTSVSYYFDKAKRSTERGTRTCAPRMSAFATRVRDYAESPRAVHAKGAMSAWCERETRKLQIEMQSATFWRALFGEFLGTMMLVVIGCGVASAKVCQHRALVNIFNVV